MSASPLSHLFNEELYTIPPIVTIIINKPWEAITEEHRTLLSKILGAVKIGLPSARIMQRKSVTLDEMLGIGAQKILLFGTQAPVNAYEYVQAQGFSIIRADELEGLDDAKKKSLWLALKTMFAA
ncbi:MAG TPA: hypothetical protein VGD40_08300 [Chryseosolibacter sp.]